MKKYIFVCLLLLACTSCGHRIYDMSEVEFRGDMVYERSSDKLVQNATIKGKLPKTPMTENEGSFEFICKDGFLEHATWFDSTGDRKVLDICFKAGKCHGPMIEFYENGQIAIETNYKDGKKDGAMKRYAEDGSLLEEITYIEDKVKS